MALDHRHRAGSPAFVGRRKFRRAAERKSGDQLDRERGGMVVINRNDDIRFGVRHPFLGFFEAGKHPLPIGLFGFLQIDRSADSRHVRGSYACNDSSHVSILPSFSASPTTPAAIW